MRIAVSPMAQLSNKAIFYGLDFGISRASFGSYAKGWCHCNQGCRHPLSTQCTGQRPRRAVDDSNQQPVRKASLRPCRGAGYLETVEPRLRRSAGHEIDASAPLDQVVATVLRLVEV